MTNLKDASNSDLEDDEENRAAMVKVLERAEYKVLETDNEPTAAGHHQRRGCRHDGDGPAVSVLDGVEVLKLTKAAEKQYLSRENRELRRARPPCSSPEKAAFSGALGLLLAYLSRLVCLQ